MTSPKPIRSSKPITRRQFNGLAVAATALGVGRVHAADPYPTRTVRIVVPFAPGALLDTTARFIAQKLSDSLGQAVIVDNRPGGESLIGIRSVKQAPADGYTLLAISGSFAQAQAMKLEPGYDSRDFIAIGGLNEAPLLMVTASSQPDMSFAQFVARAKANPDTLTFASGGVGTSAWMAGALMAHQAGIKLTHVPYKGLAAAAPDVHASRINFIFDTASSAGPHVKEGRLRALAVSTTARMSSYPTVPTLAEQGLAGYNFSVYQGLLARAGTPPDVVARLVQGVRVVVNGEEFRERCRGEGSVVMPLTPEELMERIRQDTQRTNGVVVDFGIAKT